MNAGLSDVLGTRQVDDSRLRLIVLWSLAIHLAGVVVLAVLPPGWLTPVPPKDDVMTISLGGAVGPRTTGTAPIAGKQIDQVQEQKRPEPPKPPAAVKPDTIPPPPTKPTPPKPTPPPPQQTVAAPPANVTKPPVVGARVQQGSAVTDTGASGMNQGLTVSGGAGGGDAVDLNTFHPEWVAKFKAEIARVWQNKQGEAGFVVLRFSIRRNGTVVESAPAPVDSSGQYVLNAAAWRAISEARLPPLPSEYTGDVLIVRLRFDYTR